MHRVIVVSGGGTGIGRAVAEAFASSGVGADVLLIGRRPGVLAAAADAIGAIALAADLSEPAEAERVRAAVVDGWDSVDAVVNCAGGNAVLREEQPASNPLVRAAWQWQENYRANVLTAVRLTEALKPHVSRPGGRVILLSSIAAFRGSGSGSYGGAKAALHPYAFDLAAELGPEGITVNVVAPGYVEGTEFFRGGLTPRQHQERANQALNRRAGTVSDVAQAVQWLASAAASHVTGQIIQVNGAERGR